VLHGGAEGGAQAFLLAHVGRDGDGLAAGGQDALRSLLPRRGVDLGDGDARPLPREELGRGAADAGSRPRDEGHPARQQSRHARFPRCDGIMPAARWPRQPGRWTLGGRRA